MYKTNNKEIDNYLNILCNEFPDFLYDYINTKEMQKLDKIGHSCGTTYTKVYNDKYFYSTLTHSIGVSLIIWNFTHNKVQTLSGLFHDISTPTFKHCIDFMNGDDKNQESTEEKTNDIILHSKEIMNLLKRDKININEVNNYHIYPIADNDLPKLSADRLEYTLIGGLYQRRVFELNEVYKYYNDLTILKNEDGIIELGFKTLSIAESFIERISKLWPRWVEDEDRACMQFIADIVKSLYNKNLISIDDLYKYGDEDIINLIYNSNDSYIINAFKNYNNATIDNIYKSNVFNNNIYCTSVKGKIRYINPLVQIDNKVYRIYDVSLSAKKCIDNILNLKMHKYIGFDFDFKPYNEKVLKKTRN